MKQTTLKFCKFIILQNVFVQKIHNLVFRHDQSGEEGFVNTLEESVGEKCTESKHIE